MFFHIIILTTMLLTNKTFAQVDTSIEDLSAIGQLGFFIYQGFIHILPKGFDHILFIIGLFLGSKNLKTLIVQTSLFTIAHSATLLLATLNIITFSSTFVEVLIALSIIWIGLENILFKFKKSTRNFLILSFGLIHGLGFSSMLKELTTHNILLNLFSFNIGVELGQIVILILLLVVKQTVSLIQEIPSTISSRLNVLCNTGIIVFGLIWVFERLFL